MNLELTISLVAIGLAIAGVFLAALCVIQLRNYRTAIANAAQQILQLEMLLEQQTENFDETAQKFSDHTRRLAWLEKRARQPKSLDDETFVKDISAVEPAKPNITERRHRVLTLHSRGQDAETIAATLGMLDGEVELIINLNQAA